MVMKPAGGESVPNGGYPLDGICRHDYADDKCSDGEGMAKRADGEGEREGARERWGGGGGAKGRGVDGGGGREAAAAGVGGGAGRRHGRGGTRRLRRARTPGAQHG